MGARVGNLWPVHPHRLPDELLSFWLLRTAHANYLKLQTFTNLALGRGASIWNRDIDRSASDSLFAELSDQTGSSIEDLRAGTLGAYEGIVFERHNPLGNTHWVLPLGIYHRTRRAFGMQFCPECLFWDEVPYFRRRWRMAFATMCDRHGILLHDRCPQCEAPVIYFRNDLGHRKTGKLGHHTICWQCGFDLRRAPHWGADWLDAETHTALRSLLTFFDDGFGVIGPHSANYLMSFLPVLRRLSDLLLSSSERSQLVSFRRTVEEMCGCVLPVYQGRQEIERLGLRERHRVLLCALWLLMDWPKRFLKVCRTAGVSRSYLRGDDRLLPYWFDSVLAQELDKSSYVLSHEEVCAAVSHLEVRGITVSKAKIQALTGQESSVAADPYKVIQRAPWPRSDEEYDRLLKAMRRYIRGLEKNSRRWLIAERDYAIFLLMKHTGMKACVLLGMAVDEVAALVSARSIPSLSKVIGAYLDQIRSQMLGGGPSERAFIGFQSRLLCPEVLVARIRSVCDKDRGRRSGYSAVGHHKGRTGAV